MCFLFHHLANNVEIWYNFYTGYNDYRGSTVAITDDSGAVTDTFEYDSYGKLINRTGESFVIFGYNGRDGIITDANGLLYMRARYYSPELRRFINADIIPGEISDPTLLNRYAYVNGNPVLNIDPFGLSAERNGISNAKNVFSFLSGFYDNIDVALEFKSFADDINSGFRIIRKGKYAIIKGARSPGAIKRGIAGTRYAVANADNYWNVFKNINVTTGLKSEFALANNGKLNGGAFFNYAGIAINTTLGVLDNIEKGTRTQKIVSDAVVDIGVDVGIIAASTSIGSAIGSVVPVAGNVIGAGVGMIAGYGIDWAVNKDFIGDKSLVDLAKDGAGWVADRVVEAGEWVVDKAEDLWNATTDFFEDIGDKVSSGLKSVGNFLSGIFG